MTSTGELACTYALMILHDEGIPITAEKIVKLLESANVSTESYWPMLFAQLAERRDMDDLLLSVGSSGAASAAAAPAAAATDDDAAATEGKKKEDAKDEGSDDEDVQDIFTLFDD